LPTSLLRTTRKTKMIKGNKKRKGQPIEFLGKKLDPEYYPILYKWAESNPETLKSQLLNLAKLPGGSIVNAMQSLESDLQHG